MISVIEDYFFAHLSIVKRGKTTIEKIFSSIYKDNIQIKKGDFSAFYKVNPLLLYFFNSINCCRQLALTCFANDSIHRNLVLKILCYNNYLYSLYKSINIEDDFDVLK